MGAVECKHAQATSVSSSKMFPFCLCSLSHILAHCGLYLHADDRLIVNGTGEERREAIQRNMKKEETEFLAT